MQSRRQVVDRSGSFDVVIGQLVSPRKIDTVVSSLEASTMSSSSLIAPRDRISGRSSPHRMLTLQRGRGRQEVFVMETGRFDLRIASESPLSISEAVEFELATGFPAEVKKWRGVVHWTFANRKLNEAGIALTAPVPPELVIASSSSMRSSVRFPCRLAGKIVSLKDGKKLTAKTINYSRSGMLLQTSTEYQIGDRIVFEWYSVRSQLPSQQHRSVEAVVRWTSKESDSYLLGCETSKDTLWCLSDTDICRKLRTADPRDASF